MRAFFFALFVSIVALLPVRAYAMSEALEMLPEGEVLVVLDERQLYFKPVGEEYAYFIPVAVGKPGMDEGILGTWKITRSEEWPTWTPTKAMLTRNCAKYCKWAGGMPGGLDNPLGAHALYLGASSYRLHGTNEPASIGKAISSGCIRMHNEDAVWLAKQVGIGTAVTVVRFLEDYLDHVPAGGTFPEDSREEEIATSLY